MKPNTKSNIKPNKDSTMQPMQLPGIPLIITFEDVNGDIHTEPFQDLHCFSDPDTKAVKYMCGEYYITQKTYAKIINEMQYSTGSFYTHKICT